MKKIMCFTHGDLDGWGCYQLIRWTYPKHTVEYLPSTVNNFREDYTKWLGNNDVNSYEKIYITDMDVAANKDLVDQKNFFIIDHHKSHQLVANYTKAKTLIMDFSSATKLAYKAFCSLYDLRLSAPQKLLISIIDDYDSYHLTVPQSRKLNIVFWETNNRFDTFAKVFAGGFRGFTMEQENIVKLHEINLNKLKESLKLYSGTIKIQGKNREVFSTFANEYINDVADILLQEYNADIAIVVNIKTNHISLRKQANDHNKDLDLSQLAKTIADGAGHEYASGGNITPKFGEFTRLLKPLAF